MNEKRAHRESVRSLGEYFAENTSMHGVARIVGKPGLTRRMFWILAVLAGAGVAVYNIWTIFIAFGTREVSTVVSLEYNTKLRFPAITICNINAAKKSKLMNVSSNYDFDLGEKKTVSSEVPEADSPEPIEALGISDVTDTPITPPSLRTPPSGSYSQEYRAALSFQQALSNLPPRVRTNIGHQLEDMLIECSYQGKTCTPRNFTKFYNYMHGNCYTFSTTATDEMYTTKTGPLYGLSIMLNVEEDEYVRSLTNRVGFKVTVHNVAAMPFPEDEGFDISPGFATSVGVQKVFVERTPSPYGNCEIHGQDGPPNIFSTQVENIRHSDKACEKSCLQAQLVNSCGCCDMTLPCDAAALGLIMETVPSLPLRQCDTSRRNGDSCEMTVLKKFEDGDTPCQQRCTPNCRDESYQVELSTAMWPATGHVPKLADTFVDRLISNGRKVPISRYSSDKEKENFFRQNALTLNVFYKSLNYVKIETRPAYNWKSLLSDVGGQAGLWLGFSLLTLWEIFELIVDVVVHVVTKACRQDQVKPVTVHH